MKKKTIGIIVVTAAVAAITAGAISWIAANNTRADYRVTASSSPDGPGTASRSTSAPSSASSSGEPDIDYEQTVTDDTAADRHGDLDDAYAWKLVTFAGSGEDTDDGEAYVYTGPVRDSYYVVYPSSEPYVVHSYVVGSGNAGTVSYIVRYRKAEPVTETVIREITGQPDRIIIQNEDITPTNVVNVPDEKSQKKIYAEESTTVKTDTDPEPSKINAGSTFVNISVDPATGGCATSVVGASVYDVQGIHWYLVVSKGSAKLVRNTDPLTPTLVMSDDCEADLSAVVTFEDGTQLQSNTEYVRLTNRGSRTVFSDGYLDSLDMFDLPADTIESLKSSGGRT